MAISPRERIRGCFLGGAIGDALGAAVEFDFLDEIREQHGPDGLIGYAPVYGRLGAITDDTQMALFTAEGLLRARARAADRGLVDVQSIVHQAYMRWLVTQGGPEIPDPDLGSPSSGWLITHDVLHHRRAPGNTCLGALESAKRGTIEEPLNDSKGCGAVMRAAPAGLTGEDAFELGAEIAAITHGHPSGFLAAGALALIIDVLLHGGSLPDAVEAALERLESEPRHEETAAALQHAVVLATSGAASADRVEALGGGWVSEQALAIGVYCALVAPDVRSGLLLAVNHGGDSDSTGAIAGNILGTMHGAGALPFDLLEGLEARDLIETVASDFADAFVDGNDPRFERYPPN